MRVLFDHQIFSYQKFGGASRYFCELMNEFDRMGEPQFDLGVAASPNEYLAQTRYLAGKRLVQSGVPAFLKTYLRNEVCTARLARSRPHDVMHATFYDPGALRHLRGAKLVVTVLDMIPERFPEFFEVTGLYGRFVTRRWIEGKRELCLRADKILAISEQTKLDLVERFSIDPAQIIVTHLGNRLQPTPGAVRPQGFPERYLLFVGTRNTYKNFAFFLDAAQPVLADDPTLGIVCVGGGAFHAAEKAHLKTLGIESRVLQRGVADHELSACYQHALAFVFPSLYEGFGIPILEAFACACPALLAQASCFPEIAADAALYFDPADPPSLRAALRRLIGDAALAAVLRAKGLARAAAFTWEATALRTLQAYGMTIG
jgi:glycosyltransferase involved in cell wall biosynthesis